MPLPRLDADDRRRAVKRVDAWWTVLVIDPIALRVLPFLVGRPAVTPMRLTAAAAVPGAASVGLFFAGHLVLAAVLFQLRFLLDCLDGKLARLRRTASPRGAFVDLMADVALVSAAIAGLGWHVVRERDVRFELPAAVLVASSVLFWLILYDLAHPATVPGRVRSGRLSRWMARHRLERLPRTVEVEAGLLFLAPLTGSTTVLVVALVLALGYYVLAGLRLVVVLYRRLPADSPAPAERPAAAVPQ